MQRACIGVGFGLGPSMSVRQATKPGMRGGDVNLVGSTEMGEGAVSCLGLLVANVTGAGGLYSSLNMGMLLRILAVVD